MAGSLDKAANGCMGCGCGLMVLGIMLGMAGFLILLAIGAASAPAG